MTRVVAILDLFTHFSGYHSVSFHLCPEMNASIVSEYFIRHFHILHISYNFVCFGGISLMRTLCDAYYEEDESH